MLGALIIVVTATKCFDHHLFISKGQKLGICTNQSTGLIADFSHKQLHSKCINTIRIPKVFESSKLVSRGAQNR